MQPVDLPVRARGLVEELGGGAFVSRRPGERHRLALGTGDPLAEDSVQHRANFIDRPGQRDVPLVRPPSEEGVGERAGGPPARGLSEG
jgi:hypothetical protein